MVRFIVFCIKFHIKSYIILFKNIIFNVFTTMSSSGCCFPKAFCPKQMGNNLSYTTAPPAYLLSSSTLQKLPDAQERVKNLSSQGAELTSDCQRIIMSPSPSPSQTPRPLSPSDHTRSIKLPTPMKLPIALFTHQLILLLGSGAGFP